MARLTQSLAGSGVEVEVLSLNPRKHRGTPAGPVPIHAVDIDTSRRLVPALRASTSSVPLIAARFVSSEFRDALRATLRRFNPDIVQIESPFLLSYTATVRAESKARVVLRSLNVEFRIWEGLARIERRSLRRLVLKWIASSLKAYELRGMQKLDAIIPISYADAADYRNLGITRPIHVVPCGVSLDNREVEKQEPNTVAFIGSLDFLPNQNAATWILDELWPRVARAMPDARLSIAGSSPPEWLRRRAAKRNVELRGDVDDAAAFLRRKAVVIAPMFAGGGMRIKVLDAMALGKAVVATTIGAGGIDVANDRDIVIEDDADAFADAVVRLLREPATAARIGAAARVKVAERYDSAALARDLIRFYESLERGGVSRG
jgi:glycosyltransferase involved in cell wall biosynthesis